LIDWVAGLIESRYAQNATNFCPTNIYTWSFPIPFGVRQCNVARRQSQRFSIKRCTQIPKQTDIEPRPHPPPHELSLHVTNADKRQTTLVLVHLLLLLRRVGGVSLFRLSILQPEGLKASYLKLFAPGHATH